MYQRAVLLPRPLNKIKAVEEAYYLILEGILVPL
jgi:hypothetical protein